MANTDINSVKDFASLIHDLLKSDRDVSMGVGGFTGEGKSTFTINLQKEYALKAKNKWSFKHNITWSRKELLEWIDGDKEGKHQKPEYTAILADELISMFFNRNWYDDPQKAAVELLNKCRDRHLFIAGNVPNFWQLDSGLQSRMRFYAYIPRGRGKAWIFEQEDNPFTQDSWNRTENLKVFRKKGTPFKCPNFLAEIHFGDLTPQDKIDYLAVRNTKRKDTENQNKEEKIERYGKIKRQRDLLIRALIQSNPELKIKDIAEEILEGEVTAAYVSMISNGLV